MKKRAEIKQYARESFVRQYGMEIAVILISSIIPILMSWVWMIFSVNFWGRMFFVFQPELLRTVSMGISYIALMILLFLAQPVLGVGNARAFLSSYDGARMGAQDVFEGFKRLGQSLGGMLWMLLWIFLWSLLLVVPGIVKSYSYFATPYILAECPRVYGPDAVEISRRMMKGHRGKVFLAQLTFLGWFFLCLLTMGILWILYVGPYYNTVMAGFYREIKRDAIARGIVTEEEFGGAELRQVGE